jgi:hypothetical protein
MKGESHRTMTAQASELFNVARKALSASLLKVFGFREFSLSGLNERIAPGLRTELAFDLQQKAKKTLRWSLSIEF